MAASAFLYLAVVFVAFPVTFAVQCYDEVNGGYVEGGDKTCWTGQSGRDQQPCAAFSKKKRGYFLCVEGKSLPQGCESKTNGRKISIGAGEIFKG